MLFVPTFFPFCLVWKCFRAIVPAIKYVNLYNIPGGHEKVKHGKDQAKNPQIDFGKDNPDATAGKNFSSRILAMSPNPRRKAVVLAGPPG